MNEKNQQKCDQIEKMARIAIILKKWPELQKVALKAFRYKFVLARDEFQTYLATNPSNGKNVANATTSGPITHCPQTGTILLIRREKSNNNMIIL